MSFLDPKPGGWPHRRLCSPPQTIPAFAAEPTDLRDSSCDAEGGHHCVGLPEAHLMNAWVLPDQNLSEQKRHYKGQVPKLLVRVHRCVFEACTPALLCVEVV
eukprot:883818-Pelagomonas_calceolata.AAC.5